MGDLPDCSVAEGRGSSPATLEPLDLAARQTQAQKFVTAGKDIFGAQGGGFDLVDRAAREISRHNPRVIPLQSLAQEVTGVIEMAVSIPGAAIDSPQIQFLAQVARGLMRVAREALPYPEIGLEGPLGKKTLAPWTAEETRIVRQIEGDLLPSQRDLNIRIEELLRRLSGLTGASPS